MQESTRKLIRQLEHAWCPNPDRRTGVAFARYREKSAAIADRETGWEEGL